MLLVIIKRHLFKRLHFTERVLCLFFIFFRFLFRFFREHHVDIRLVHNTGGAWGIFSDSTFALGVFSLIVCAVLAGSCLATLKASSFAQVVSFALIVAGGIGNAIDRFVQGFVTDFIEFSFIDFPVFNVADIGVTCGFALLVIALILEWRKGCEETEREAGR